jgi:hypothetical protein
MLYAFLFSPFVLHAPPILSIQGIRPGPRLLVYFRNRLIYLLWVVSPTPNPQAGGSPLVGCQQLLIQYIHSCPPNPEGVSSGRAMPWWQGTHLTWKTRHVQFKSA